MKKYFLLLSFLVAASTINITSFAAAIVPVSSSSMIVPSGEPAPGTIKAAIDEFKSLSRKDRKARIKEVKKDLKAFRRDKKAGKEPSDNTVLLCILAVLLPPLAVYLHEGEVNSRFWISLLLTLLFWIPGIIYALVIILSDD